MDFYSAQDEAHARTKRLLVLFAAAVFSTVLAVHLGVEWMISWQTGSEFHFIQHWRLLPWTAGLTLLPMLIGVLVKHAALSGGGGAVAEALGGRRVATDTTDFLEKRLLNVVEEVAIASGVRVPEVWILEEENAINAFAAGTDPSRAAVAFSRGSLEHLSRDELQGVVGHEFSHILNGDMRLNFRMMTWISGILVLSVLGQVLIRLAPHVRGSSSSRRSDSGRGSAADALPLLFFVGGIGLLVIGSVGAFFARWIQAAISRQREFLADASAVQFTRNPHGIAGALKKIGGYSQGARLEAARASEVAHMVFCDGSSSLFASLFATHPPLAERIQRIEPAWDETRAEGLPPEAASSGEPVSRFAGTTGGANFVEARQLFEGLPEEWVAVARKPESAGQVVLELIRAVEQEDGAGRAGLCAYTLEQRMALLDLALSAARQLPREEVRRLLDSCEGQVVADGVLNLFEMMQMQAVRRHLGVASGVRPEPSPIYREASSLADAFLVVLSAMAALSGGEASGQDAAFARGWSVFSLGAVTRLPVSEIPVLRIEQALSECEKGSASLRGALLRSCYAVASEDGRCNELETAFVRAVGDAVGVPVPPPLKSAEPEVGRG